MVHEFNLHKKPPFLEKRDVENNINNARPLLVLGDSITTDHISPAGVIKKIAQQQNISLNIR